jgi:predicted negative regulator of RcsB-dependent stress response
VEYDYQDELQQVEAIKKWWRDNGASVLTGIVLGLTLLFGWRYWQDYTEANAQKASSMYEQVVALLEKKQVDQARQIAASLVSQYSQSAYAAMTELLLARQDLEEKNIASSYARLQWIIDWKGQAELANVARLRKARLYLSENKLEDAKNLLAAASDTDRKSFQAAFAELQGDIAVLEGKVDVARTAYQQALESKELANQQRTWVQTKLDNLGIAADKRVSAAPPKVSEAAPPQPAVSMSNAPAGLNLSSENAPSQQKTVATQPATTPVVPESQPVMPTPAPANPPQTMDAPHSAVPPTAPPQ